jgi:ATP-binding cassette subfamily C protein
LGVSVSEVYFGYSNSAGDVLQNINLVIPAGSQAALIGPSGAGKSTLADIILGLVTPDQGKIELAGVGAADLIQSQPGLLGYVPQKPGMVSGSIAQNVALGVDVDEIDQQRLSKAISDAHLMGLVESLPNGINTDIGKRKDELSGGQLQRIGLARALYTQPKLLVMDEATSALDAESENEINKALDDLRGKVTVILIAHRLNTVQRSDIVFLMEEGKITDSGTFPELLKKNKTVQNLAQLMSIDTDSSKANQ